MVQKQIEIKSLVVNCIVNLVMSGAGLWVFSITKIQALFLDGFFSFIAFGSCLAALTISKISNKKTENYPNGLYFLEPLYAVFKSLFTLVLLTFSVMEAAKAAWKYFISGAGNPLVFEPVIPYAVIMGIMCFGLGFFNRNQNLKINNVSTILAAESKGNFVDGILSLGVGLCAVLLKVIDINGNLRFLHYMGDFFVTTFLVLFSVKEPVAVFMSSFRELSGGAITNKELKKNICCFVEENLKGIVLLQKCEIFKIGMHIKVCIYIANSIEHEKIQSIKKNLLKDIGTLYENIEIVFCQ